LKHSSVANWTKPISIPAGLNVPVFIPPAGSDNGKEKASGVRIVGVDEANVAASEIPGATSSFILDHGALPWSDLTGPVAPPVAKPAENADTATPAAPEGAAVGSANPEDPTAAPPPVMPRSDIISQPRAAPELLTLQPNPTEEQLLEMSGGSDGEAMIPMTESAKKLWPLVIVLEVVDGTYSCTDGSSVLVLCFPRDIFNFFFFFFADDAPALFEPPLPPKSVKRATSLVTYAVLAAVGGITGPSREVLSPAPETPADGGAAPAVEGGSATGSSSPQRRRSSTVSAYTARITHQKLVVSLRKVR
jgi:hypothetical protein